MQRWLGFWQQPFTTLFGRRPFAAQSISPSLSSALCCWCGGVYHPSPWFYSRWSAAPPPLSHAARFPVRGFRCKDFPTMAFRPHLEPFSRERCRFMPGIRGGGTAMLRPVHSKQRDARVVADLDQAELLRAITQTSIECIKVVTRDGRLVQMNPAGLVMIEAE